MEINPIEYPLYPYQKRKQFEVRLKEAFPTQALIKTVEGEIKALKLENFREFQISIEVHKLEKVVREAKKYISLYEDYVEAAFPELWEKEEFPEPSYFGFVVKLIKPKTLCLPYWYQLSISPKLRRVEKEKRRMVDYSRKYQLNLRLTKDHQKWFFNFLTAFFYCQPIHRLDLVKLEIRAETFNGKINVLSKHTLTKATFRMPIWGPAGFEEITQKRLEEIFSNSRLLELLADQLGQRYPFVWCLVLNGEPIPRRFFWREIEGKRERIELTFDSAEEIAEFFKKERGVEYYRSVDKRGIDKVDTLILEYDPPLRMEKEEEIWKQTVEDEKGSLGILLRYGLNPKSIEENFSGNKSLQRLIHINPPISYQETRDIQYFLAILHKFEARDPYMYTIDKESGLARVSKELADWTYGRKKEIKCVPVPNVKREPIHCSIPLEFSIENGKIKFADWVFDLKKVREASKWENVREKLIKDEALPEEEKLFKRQSFYEKNATDPAVFRKLMKEFYWYESAMKQIPPYELDLWNKKWIKERFA